MPAKKKIAPPAAPAPASKAPAKKKTAAKKAPVKKTAPDGPVVFEGEAFARAAANYADEKKAENITILDVRGISMVTDFLVICEGSSLPHLRAIQSEIGGRLREDHKVKPYSSHGMADSGWMLLDFGDVVVHIFHAEKRAFYALEDLWSDAPRLI
jgi:ribosome-associated protein